MRYMYIKIEILYYYYYQSHVFEATCYIGLIDTIQKYHTNAINEVTQVRVHAYMFPVIGGLSVVGIGQ